MKIPPKFSTTLDLLSHGIQNDTSTTRFIPLIDDYNPYYPDPDYIFDPYWATNCYNQHQLYFYDSYNKPDQDVELDYPELDSTLNTALINARVDPWQHGAQFTTHMIQPDATDDFHRGRLQVSLASAVAARFVNTLVTRIGEPDYVPLTTNLVLKYKRRMLYFPLDFGELTLDGLVDTGALSSAISEADLRKIRLLALSLLSKRAQHPTSKLRLLMGSWRLQRAPSS